MEQDKELEYYEEIKDWNFDMFEIESESLTSWDIFEELKKIANKDSKVLDLGTGGGEKLLKFFPECEEILGTDFSTEMINTANKNLKESNRKNITFKVMDNLNMNVPNDYFDIVVARNTVIDANQIYKCLKKGGYILIGGVDQHDCYSLKMVFGKGQGYFDKKSISIIDYENIINAGFKDVELVPIHIREYFKNRFLFKEFLKKVPIIDDFSEENNDNKNSKDFYKKDIDDDLLDKYISENTFDGKIRLLRRYYGIIAKK